MPRARPEHHRFTKALAQALRHRCGIAPGDRLLVAVSGGCDSVALLRGLAALAPRRTWRLSLSVAHVQHHLRPDDQAEGDAAFVAALAQRLALPFLRADLTPPASRSRAARADNREAWARRARYAALAEMARAWDAGAIVMAHHADDQLETVLMRLLRGASVRGLSGMAWRRRLSVAEVGGSPSGSGVRSSSGGGDGGGGATSGGGRPLLLRPMLGIDRAGARAFLEAIGQDWREDQTNQDASRLRARLRRDVLPILRELRPDAGVRAMALGSHLRQAARVLDEAVARAADRVTLVEGQDVIARVDARQMPAIVLGGLLRSLLLRAGVGGDHLGRRTLGPIVRAVGDTRGGRRTFDLGAGVKLALTRQTLVIRTPPAGS